MSEIFKFFIRCNDILRFLQCPPNLIYMAFNHMCYTEGIPAKITDYALRYSTLVVLCQQEYFNRFNVAILQQLQLYVNI